LVERGIQPEPSSFPESPQEPDPQSNVPGAAGGAFSPTQWSLVLAARSGSDRRREALEQLCAAYWPPIYQFLRRRHLSPSDAEDLTQGFFVHLLESDFLDRPDPARGRFRGYLVGALKNYLAHHYEREGAAKRGGKARIVEWSSAEAERDSATMEAAGQDPAAAYETTWALTLLGRALKRLEHEQEQVGRATHFDVLKRYLSQSPDAGDYERAASELGMTRTHVAVAVHRLNQRYRELVRLEVAATVRDPTEVNDELRYLLTVLSR
jgi:RNA polymerase sigma factor (sigma-70 family)